jgi:hypothetical protein
LLGRYDSFPENVPLLAQFAYQSSTQTIQTSIARVLHTLNKESINMENMSKASPHNCFVNFEFGIGEGDAFNFLDEEELTKLEHTLKEQPLAVLDVFCIARYDIKEATGKNKSLKFDYYMLRFSFGSETMELFIHHERGIQRIPRKDLILFLKDKIDKGLVDNRGEPLTLKYIF